MRDGIAIGLSIGTVPEAVAAGLVVAEAQAVARVEGEGRVEVGVVDIGIVVMAGEAAVTVDATADAGGKQPSKSKLAQDGDARHPSPPNPFRLRIRLPYSSRLAAAPHQGGPAK